MMNPYRCEICGETYLGLNPPERCPFCGSAGKMVLPAAEWLNYGKVEMCKQSYKDCKKALKLELDAYAFYKCSASKSDNQVTEAIFQRLMDQELEHAEVFAKAMGIPLPEVPECQCCSSKDYCNYVKANKDESGAISFYTKVANRSPEPRIQQIFRAISDVENQHLILTNMYLFR